MGRVFSVMLRVAVTEMGLTCFFFFLNLFRGDSLSTHMLLTEEQLQKLSWMGGC